MKKLISCLLVVMMLVSVASAFAESSDLTIKNKAVLKFLNETDRETKDIALQIQSKEEVDDVVIRFDNDNLHLVPRHNGVEQSHIHLTPAGIYVGSADKVTLLRYDTIVTIVDDFAKEVVGLLEQIVKNIPAQAIPSDAEINETVNHLATLATEVAAQEASDSIIVASAAMSFASKFKPEYILDVKDDQGSVEISLRSEAFASAFADAVDELMTNPSLAKLVDRKAAEQGGKTFAEAQVEWLKYREETLNALRSIESTEKVEENGHWVSHFQIGEELSAVKILACDMDSWIDAENGELETKTTLGFKNEEPLLVYEFAVSPYSYREKLTAGGDSLAEVKLSFQDNQISDGEISTVIEGQEQLKAYFGPDYLYMKGPKGGISTSVRETWTGKIRYELVAETASDKESTMIIDFYEADDSLIGELSTNKSDRTVQFKLSRIDKVNIEDLSTSENITEITVDDIYNELGNILKQAVPALTNGTETAK